jgi:hypothetical protein
LGEVFAGCGKNGKGGIFPVCRLRGAENGRGGRAKFWWMGEGEEKASFAERKRREGESKD